MPTLETSDELTVYWGKNGATPPDYDPSWAWDSHFEGVWHMTETALENSSQYTIAAGTPYGTWNAISNGPAGPALDFKRANTNYVRLGDVCDVTKNFTLSGFFFKPAYSMHPTEWPSDLILSKITGAADKQYDLGLTRSGGVSLSYERDNNNYVAFTGPDVHLWPTNVSAWNHVATTLEWSANTTNLDFHVHGVTADPRDGDPTQETTDENASLDIGRFGGTYQRGYFEGLISEVRISSTARSADWLWAEWYNMASNSLFQTYGPAKVATSKGILLRMR
jgi:hypothetical protein